LFDNYNYNKVLCTSRLTVGELGSTETMSFRVKSLTIEFLEFGFD